MPSLFQVVQHICSHQVVGLIVYSQGISVALDQPEISACLVTFFTVAIVSPSERT